jgi:hypothetical protein
MNNFLARSFPFKGHRLATAGGRRTRWTVEQRDIDEPNLRPVLRWVRE